MRVNLDDRHCPPHGLLKLSPFAVLARDQLLRRIELMLMKPVVSTGLQFNISGMFCCLGTETYEKFSKLSILASSALYSELSEDLPRTETEPL